LNTHLQYHYFDSDGNIGFLFGANSTRDTLYCTYYSGGKLNIYNTITKTWSVKHLTDSPKGNGDLNGEMTMQVDHDRKLVYVMGGHYLDEGESYSVRDFFILDLVNNVWLDGDVQADSEREISLFSASSALLMNNTYFVRLLGMFRTTFIYNDTLVLTAIFFYYRYTK
jgi:hypothetical protein